MKNKNIVLRYIKESDIADYIRWTTDETEWNDWDAPWEVEEDDDFVQRQKASLEMEPHFYSKLEIETDSGRHIGWVSCYDIEFEGEEVTAVGIDIPGLDDRGRVMAKMRWPCLFPICCKRKILFMRKHGQGIRRCFVWQIKLDFLRLSG